MMKPSSGGTSEFNWRVFGAFLLVAICSGVAVVGYTHQVVHNVTDPVTRAITTRRADLVSGCERSATRAVADTLQSAGIALADGEIAADPKQSARTRRVRRASSETAWEAAASFASTLVDCKAAFPLSGKKGKAVLDVGLLQQIRVKLEARFGKIDPHILRHVGGLIRRDLAHQ